MITNLVKHGDDWAVVLDASLLTALRIQPGDPVDVQSDGTRVVISPTSHLASAVQTAREKVNERYQQVFKKLAQ